MKILYVLVSSDKDFYAEQALVSMMSARKLMPECYISLLLDSDTAKTLIGQRALIRDYVNEFKELDIDSSYTPMQKSRYLKTSMRSHIAGDFLYVDVDTVFAEALDHSDFDKELMAVPDCHTAIESHPIKNWIDKTARHLSFKIDSLWHFNGGVLFAKDSPSVHDFFEEWHRLWLYSVSKGVFIDQPALNMANENKKEMMCICKPFYNAQVLWSIRYLSRAKIIHYFSSLCQMNREFPYLFSKKLFWEQIKKEGFKEEVLESIYNPKEAFEPSTLLLGAKDLEFFKSECTQYIWTLSQSPHFYARFLLKLNTWILRFFFRFYNVFYQRFLK